MSETAQSESSVKDLQAEIDLMLLRREPLAQRRLRRIALTESNVRRLFGMTMEELFAVLAEKLGYEIK